MHTFFVDVILPLPLEARFTYRVPQVMNGRIAFGMRVIVPFGNSKLYAAIVERVHGCVLHVYDWGGDGRLAAVRPAARQ